MKFLFQYSLIKFKITYIVYNKFSNAVYGGIAQMGERLTGSQKVMGSSPVISTILLFTIIL